MDTSHPNADALPLTIYLGANTIRWVEEMAAEVGIDSSSMARVLLLERLGEEPMPDYMGR